MGTFNGVLGAHCVPSLLERRRPSVARSHLAKRQRTPSTCMRLAAAVLFHGAVSSSRGGRALVFWRAETGEFSQRVAINVRTHDEFRLAVRVDATEPTYRRRVFPLSIVFGIGPNSTHPSFVVAGGYKELVRVE